MHAFPRRLDKTKTNLKPDHCNNSALHNKPSSVAVGKTNSLRIDGERDLNSEVECVTPARDSVGFQHKLAETGRQVGEMRRQQEKRLWDKAVTLFRYMYTYIWTYVEYLDKKPSYPIYKMEKCLT